MTSPNESRQVLDMLAEGRITAEEAQGLLEKLASTGTGGAGRNDRPVRGASDRDDSSPSGHTTTAAVLVSPTRTRPRYLRILINTSGNEEINIRIPLQLVRAGVKLAAILPNDARQKMQESGIDLSKLSELEGDELIDALRDLSIDVDSSEGETVRIFCE